MSELITLPKLGFDMAEGTLVRWLKQVGDTLAVIGAVVGEFITGQGIGGAISVAQQRQRVDLIFAGILLASLLGLTLFGAINLASWLTLRRWHASESRN